MSSFLVIQEERYMIRYNENKNNVSNFCENKFLRKPHLRQSVLQVCKGSEL